MLRIVKDPEEKLAEDIRFLNPDRFEKARNYKVSLKIDSISKRPLEFSGGLLLLPI